MICFKDSRDYGRGGAITAALALLFAVLTACASTGHLGGGQSEQTATIAPPPAEPPASPPQPPPPQPPPVDLAGRWKLSLAGGGTCLLTLSANPGATEGAVAPAGGCPGNFFMSRKWTFEHDRLSIRDHKGEALVQLSFADGSFAGQVANGAAVTLAR